MAGRRPPPKSRLCSDDWRRRANVAESLHPCLWVDVLNTAERKKATEHGPSFSKTDFIRTFCANGTCMTSYIEKANQPTVDGDQPNVFISDLVVDIRLCKLFRGLALIPRLYRLLCILRNCQIQSVHASSERCQSARWRGSCETWAHLSLSITP
jgi:hypothetical protein